jgi:hypothetical protein
MRDDAGLRYLYADDPLAATLTRADYRRRLGVLPAGEEGRPPRRPVEKVAGKVVLEPHEPWLKAPTLYGPYQLQPDGRPLAPRDFRLVCTCRKCGGRAEQRDAGTRDDRLGVKLANPYREPKKDGPSVLASARPVPLPRGFTAWPRDWRDQWSELGVGIRQAERLAGTTSGERRSPRGAFDG